MKDEQTRYITVFSFYWKDGMEHSRSFAAFSVKTSYATGIRVYTSRVDIPKWKHESREILLGANTKPGGMFGMPVGKLFYLDYTYGA
jgi:hypothetical protein